MPEPMRQCRHNPHHAMPPESPYLYCDDCRKDATLRVQQQRMRLAQRGVCRECRAAPVTPGYVTCQPCRLSYNAYKRLRARQRKETV